MAKGSEANLASSSRAQLKYRLAWAWVHENHPSIATQLAAIAEREFPGTKRSASRETSKLLKGVKGDNKDGR